MSLAQFGPEAMVASGIQLPAIFKRIFDAYHFPMPDELISPDATAMQEQARQAQVAQQNPFLQAQAKAHAQIAGEREKGDQQTMQKLLDAAMQLHQPQAPENAA